MKFLCIECDAAMKLADTRGPDDGSMTVIFSCPKCGKSVAMLTNAMETQMVRSLDVKIGGKPVAAEPMGMVRESLAQKREDIFSNDLTPSPAVAEQAAEKRSGSKCPFTGAVNEAYEKNENAADGPVWSQEAQTRLERIPSFVRPMVKKSIEQHARDNGYKEITAAVMEEIKDRFGM